MSHYKLENYDQARADAERAIEIDPKSLKGYYYLGLAQRQLGSHTSAENNLRRAYEIALNQKSPSATAVYEDILIARKLRVRAQEQQRIRKQAPLLAELQDLLTAKYEADVDNANATLQGEELSDELDYLRRTHEEKLKSLESTFAKADKELESQEVPDYLLDPISFNLFLDPVIVKSGQSFERSWILQHLKTSQTDPFSRERLTEKDLIPNLQLKAAAEVSFS